jgi:hypothetical protein
MKPMAIAGVGSAVIKVFSAHRNWKLSPKALWWCADDQGAMPSPGVVGDVGSGEELTRRRPWEVLVRLPMLTRGGNGGVSRGGNGGVYHADCSGEAAGSMWRFLSLVLEGVLFVSLSIGAGDTVRANPCTTC